MNTPGLIYNNTSALKMPVLLVHPPDSKHTIAPGRFEPLALEILSATIPGHPVQIVDLRIDPLRELVRIILSMKPGVIGMTVNNTVHVTNAHKILRLIRQIDRKARIIVGGHHVTMLPDDFRETYVDAIFYGWAEQSFPEYIAALCNGKVFDHIPGIEILQEGKTVMRNDNNWELTPSEIPYPRRDLVSKYLSRYRNDMGFKTSLVNTARGCPNRCSFCCVWKATKGHFLLREAEDVFREIVSLPDHIKYVFFADDNTFIDPERAMKLAQLLKNAGVKKKYSGYCRSDTIVNNPELMRIWGEIGLRNLCVGFEVVDDQGLKAFNKKNQLSNNIKAAGILNDLDIPFRPHFLVEPSFGKEQFERIFRFVRKNNLLSPIFPILTPIPGTADYDHVRDYVHLGYDYFDYAHAVVPTKLKPEEFYWSWIRLYWKSYPVLRNLIRALGKRYGILISDRDLVKKNHHLRLKNLFILKIYALYLIIKLVRHYRMEEKLLASFSNVPATA